MCGECGLKCFNFHSGHMYIHTLTQNFYSILHLTGMLIMLWLLWKDIPILMWRLFIVSLSVHSLPFFLEMFFNEEIIPVNFIFMASVLVKWRHLKVPVVSFIVQFWWWYLYIICVTFWLCCKCFSWIFT